MAGDCGTCTLCCKLLGIAEIEKPADKWCEHCDKSKGCSIYEDRPESCQAFSCLWLISQTESEAHPMPLNLRPDKCKVVLYPQEDDVTVSAHVDPAYPMAWKQGPIYEVIKGLAAHAKMRVLIGPSSATKRKLMKRHGHGVALYNVEVSEPDENGIVEVRTA